MRHYQGLPAAANVEQAIILAQMLILRDLSRREPAISDRAAQANRETLPTVTDRRV